jgi:hypothetical protein
VLDPKTFAWRDALILTREIDTAGERTDFYARVHRGEFVALRRGVYMTRERWGSLDLDEQYRARVQANVAFADRPVVISHISAASLWRLPLIGRQPRSVHMVGELTTGGRSTSALAYHADDRPPAVAMIDGILVTSLARTVVDVARSCDLAESVAIADVALHRSLVPVDDVPRVLIGIEDLRAEVALLPIPLGTAKARRVVEFADARADRPGESISRVNIHRARLTAPELQARLRGASGRVWHVDFWWPAFNLIGEFDGKAKYTDEKYLRGRTPAQVLYDEKIREDDLRAARHGFARWPWEVAISVPRLRAHLIAAGVR